MAPEERGHRVVGPVEQGALVTRFGRFGRIVVAVLVAVLAFIACIFLSAVANVFGP